MEKKGKRCGVEGLSLHPLLMVMLGLDTYFLEGRGYRKKKKGGRRKAYEEEGWKRRL